MKEETRGRKPKVHAPIKATFDQVLKAVGKSKYQNEKTITKSKNKKHGQQ